MAQFYPPPSDTISGLLKDKSLSTITRDNEIWYREMFIKRSKKKDVIEYNNMSIMQEGRIYTFQYDPITKDKLDFYDNNPISLIIHHVPAKGGKGWNALGINLSYMPPKIRTKILDKIWQVFYNKGIKANQDDIFKGKKNVSATKYADTLDYDRCVKILKNSGFEFAIRSYRYDHIEKKPMTISYEDWYRVCTFTSKYIRKINIRAVYYRYLKAHDNRYKIGQKFNKTVKILNEKTKRIKDD